MSVTLASKTFMPWAFKKPLPTIVILKVKDLKTTNRDRKKVTKQGSILFSWHSIFKLQIPILTLYM